MTYFLFILGFLLLIKGADLLVDGASAIAQKYKVPDLVIGLTIVAFGTSAPELVISGIASYQGNGEIALANVLGSNVANTLLILGATALIYPLVVKSSVVKKELPLNILSVGLLALLANDLIFRSFVQVDANLLSRFDGIILLLVFLLFICLSFRDGKFEEENNEPVSLNLNRAIIYLLVGLIGLSVGGKWIVDGAVQIATLLGVSNSFVGLTIIAIGTSLPELAASVMAALKKKPDLAVGNALGSNLFNILWILGASSLIRPLPYSPSNNIDLLVVLASYLLLGLFIWLGKQRFVINRIEGALMVICYIGYLIFLYFNQ